ncbi:TolC family protein [Gloeobacter morelensis]|uniref:TolC family protein n=1 Tax=Gloeobacter morelensis MG652769 TaxID=2781736 RepID=A0ABY3PTF6_9CYAN|nr:TolC family protein [Gloeobacter morelensis]UFP96768.1 TolC family protein [Gloeobacter morelensis MG652769]
MQRRSATVLFAMSLYFCGPFFGAQAADTPNTQANALGVEPLTPTLPSLPTRAVELKVETIQPLKLQDAVDIALARSPQLQLALVAVEKAEGSVREQSAGLYPTVQTSLSYSYVQSATSKISAALLATSSLSSALAVVESAPLNGQIEINWTIFSSGLVGSNIRTAAQNLSAARLDYARTRQDLIDSVITAYYDLQNADGNVAIGEASVKSAEASYQDARAQERAGTGTRFASLQAEVQLANARVELLQYQNRRIVAQRNLARQLNFARPTDVTAAEAIEQGESWKLSLEQTIFEAYRNRAELPRYLALEQVAKAQEEAYYASVAPQVSVFLTGQVYDNTIDRVTGAFTGYSAGVQIQWNAFDGGAAAARASQAAADAKSARLNYIDTLNTVRYGVEGAYTDMLTAMLRIDTTSTSVTSAEESLRLARLRFQAGVGTQTDVLTADRDLTQARVNRLTAIIDFNRAVASIKRAVGVL